MKSSISTYSTIIVDDHQLFADGLVRILQDETDFVISGICNSAEQLLKQLKERVADLVILDNQMPQKSGLEICPEIKQQYPNTKVVFISMLDEWHIIKEVSEAGADGFIPKTTDASLLKTTLRAICRGEQVFISPKKNDQVKGTLANLGIEQLTAREREVIKLIKEGKTSKAIAESLFLSEFTVETHRKNILRKLQLNSATELIAYAFEHHL